MHYLLGMAMKKHTSTRKVRRHFFWLVPLLSTALTLLLIEIALAVFHPIPFALEDNMYFSPDPFTGYRLKPNGIGHFILGIEGRANSRGHRDREIDSKRPAGVVRILVLGDSFTVGANVTQEQAYPEVLEMLLIERLGNKVEVVNTGVGGWNPFQYSQYYEHYGSALQAQVVIVGFFVGNDTYSTVTDVEHTLTAVLGRRVPRSSHRDYLTVLRVLLYQHSHLARLLMTRINHLTLASDFGMTRESCEEFPDRYLALQKEKVPNHLKRSTTQEEKIQVSLQYMAKISALAKAQGARLLVALLPDENQINPRLWEKLQLSDANTDLYDLEMPQSLLVERLTELDIEVLDLLPLFRNDGRCLYMNDTHWDPTGHELAAKALAEALLTRRFLQ